MKKIVVRNSDGANTLLDISKDTMIFDQKDALIKDGKTVGERFYTIFCHDCKDGTKEYYIFYQSTAEGDTEYINYPDLGKIKRMLTGQTELMDETTFNGIDGMGLILREEDMQ